MKIIIKAYPDVQAATLVVSISQAAQNQLNGNIWNLLTDKFANFRVYAETLSVCPCEVCGVGKKRLDTFKGNMLLVVGLYCGG